MYDSLCDFRTYDICWLRTRVAEIEYRESDISKYCWSNGSPLLSCNFPHPRLSNNAYRNPARLNVWLEPGEFDIRLKTMIAGTGPTITPASDRNLYITTWGDLFDSTLDVIDSQLDA